MKRLVVMIAPFNTRSGYGDHARSLFYSIMDREDMEIKCVDTKWGATPRNHLRPEVPRHKKLLDTFVNPEQLQNNVFAMKNRHVRTVNATCRAIAFKHQQSSP